MEYTAEYIALRDMLAEMGFELTANEMSGSQWVKRLPDTEHASEGWVIVSMFEEDYTVYYLRAYDDSPGPCLTPIGQYRWGDLDGVGALLQDAMDAHAMP